jgi:hypothetical protein
MVMKIPPVEQQSEFLTRRRWPVAGGAAMWSSVAAAAADELAMPKTPQEAVEFLYAGNRRLLRAGLCRFNKTCAA